MNETAGHNEAALDRGEEFHRSRPYVLLAASVVLITGAVLPWIDLGEGYGTAGTSLDQGRIVLGTAVIAAVCAMATIGRRLDAKLARWVILALASVAFIAALDTYRAFDGTPLLGSGVWVSLAASLFTAFMAAIPVALVSDHPIKALRALLAS